MSKRALVIFLLLVGMAAGQTKPSRAPTPKPETPYLRFVKEYVRELIADESLKIYDEKEFGEAKTNVSLIHLMLKLRSGWPPCVFRRKGHLIETETGI